MDAELAHQQREMDRLQQRPIARTNKNSLPVDPLTLDYQATRQGEALRARDEAQRGRAAARAERLYSKMHSAQGFDLITGLPK
jgi:hypothetical protein